jgi:hypothetical protein
MKPSVAQTTAYGTSAEPGDDSDIYPRKARTDAATTLAAQPHLRFIRGDTQLFIFPATSALDPTSPAV